MINRGDILKGEVPPEEFEINLGKLLHRLNMLEQFVQNDLPDFKFKITSGYRTRQKHLAIYAKRGITDEKKVPMHSQHLSASACDVFDPDKKLQNWCLRNESKLEEIGLWCEDFRYTKNWCHLQITPPLSGKRFFIP